LFDAHSRRTCEDILKRQRRQKTEARYFELRAYYP
jgi:hypothetical protein